MHTCIYITWEVLNVSIIQLSHTAQHQIKWRKGIRNVIKKKYCENTCTSLMMSTVLCKYWKRKPLVSPSRPHLHIILLMLILRLIILYYSFRQTLPFISRSTASPPVSQSVIHSFIYLVKIHINMNFHKKNKNKVNVISDGEWFVWEWLLGMCFNEWWTREKEKDTIQFSII